MAKAINDEQIDVPSDLVKSIGDNEGAPVRLTVRRSNLITGFDVTPEFAITEIIELVPRDDPPELNFHANNVYSQGEGESNQYIYFQLSYTPEKKVNANYTVTSIPNDNHEVVNTRFSNCRDNNIGRPDFLFQAHRPGMTSCDSGIMLQ